MTSTSFDFVSDKDAIEDTICPRCGGELVLRTNRQRGNQFFGCSNWKPRQRGCNYTRSVAASAPVVVPVVQKEFTPSAYQQAILDAIENETGNIVVQATAGSGKTATAVLIAKLVKRLQGEGKLPSFLDVTFLAFNKSIAVTLSERLPEGFPARTIHSLGLRSITTAWGRVKIDKNKDLRIVDKLVEDRYDYRKAEIAAENKHTVARLVSLLKTTLVKNPTFAEMAYLSERHGLISNGDEDEIFAIVKDVFTMSVRDQKRINFDDMVYFPAIGRVPCKQFDFIIVDETQDLNPAQLQFILNSRKPHARVIAVGDVNQSIYGFASADVDSMPKTIKALDAQVLPLSISYRNSHAVVKHVNGIFPHIRHELFDGAQAGTVKTITESDFHSQVQDADLVLCRTNAPLVSTCYALIRNGIKAGIVGRDIGEALVSFVKKIQRKTGATLLDDFLSDLQDYTDKEISRLIRLDRTTQAQSLEDKYETVLAIAEGRETVNELTTEISRLFSDDVQGVSLSTVHKAKGSEAENVYIIRPDQLPLGLEKPWEQQQERNIQFVALTRAVENLYYVG